MSNKTNLEKYLFEPSNSHAKESLINNKLLFDLKLSAARRGYFLNAYTPEVDKDGFDIIFDDQDSMTKVQLKTVMEKAGTTSWDIHKTILRPDPMICEDLGFEPSPMGTGHQGGVILIEISDCNQSGFSVQYYYTDIIVLCALRDGLIEVDEPPQDRVIKTFFENINTGRSHEKIALNKKMFLKATSPEGLLAIMGLHNSLSTGIFRFHIQKLAKSQLQKQLAAPRDTLVKIVRDEIKKIASNIAP
ncbi:hypothetical protein [Vibrio harveyi]|uniref:hypothetical protein n=1 Tax=Vibrio harveyi TaxID=669 RepID=UPI0006802A26|nr:hypothetical protein [Vibrio harveyi]